MLYKFAQTTDSTVFGLSLHRKKLWILASMESGAIELWDYQRNELIQRYSGGGGCRSAVRSVHFHNFRPIFASGGDDCMVKIWSYECHRCLNVLGGHLDRICSVHFHHECPWIISASRDHKMRIWNWQSGTCVCILAKHTGPVVSAFFHPIEDFVLSASYDGSAQIWNFATLKKKMLDSTFHGTGLSEPSEYPLHGTDVYVSTYLENSYCGMHWASFHPSHPTIVCTVACHEISLWRKKDAKPWGTSMLLGHEKLITCLLFDSRTDFMVSCSHDKTIRIWDTKKKKTIRTLNCAQNKKLWVLASHLERNFLAAGHDSGFFVFKLERGRPDFSISGNFLLYMKDQFLHLLNFSTQKDVRLIPSPRFCSDDPSVARCSLSYSPAEHAALISSNADGDSYELFIVPEDGYGGAHAIQEGKKGTGGSAVFVAQSIFAVLEKSCKEVSIRNLENDIVKKIVLPIHADAIFYAGTGTLLCRAEDRVVIFDLQCRVVVGDLKIPGVRYIVWSRDLESVALLQKYCIVIADRRLVERFTLQETFTVKSGAWDDDGVFIYSTIAHIKYCLPNGESGIIKTLDGPLYIIQVRGNIVFGFDKGGKVCSIVIDPTEYVWKMSVLRRNYDQVLDILRKFEPCPLSLIEYLLQEGLSEVALHYVKDKKTRLNLTLRNENMPMIAAVAEGIVEIDNWYGMRLGEVALRYGYASIAEYAYMSTKKFRKLSFLYLLTGNLEKLSKMRKVSGVKKDVTSQLHDALFLGDIEERVTILRNSGQLPLAYITSSVHGLYGSSERLAAELGDNVPHLPKGKFPSLLIPPKPILRGGDWPLLMALKGISEGYSGCPAEDLNTRIKTLTKRRSTSSLENLTLSF